MGNDQYQYLVIGEDSEFIVDDGVIIGFLVREQLKGHPFPFVKPPKYREVLVRLNPDTGESELLCKTEGNSGSLIGYREGRLYLVKNFKVYRRDLDSGVEEELFELPEGDRFFLSWRAGYLLIRKDDGGREGELKIHKLE